MGIIPPESLRMLLNSLQHSSLPQSSSQVTKFRAVPHCNSFISIGNFPFQTAINPSSSLSNTFPSYLPQYDIGGNFRPTTSSVFTSQLMSQLPTSQSTLNMLQSGYGGTFSQLPTNLLQSQLELEGIGPKSKSNFSSFRNYCNHALYFFFCAARAMKNGTLPGSGFASSSDLLLPHDDLVLDNVQRRGQDLIEIPGKGLCNIFIAKYSYDPCSQSTNMCPEAELAINAGDYLLVYGEPDDVSTMFN